MAGLKDYNTVFTPEAPIESKKLLFGREQEIADVSNSLKRKGSHPIVIGDRGVGKTSLVHVALQQRPHVTITCGQNFTFGDLAQSVISQLSDLKASRPHEASAFKPFHVAPEEARLIQRISAWQLFEALRAIGSSATVVIDEYDRIGSSAKEFHASVADLLKHLSDNNVECPTKLVIVGVAHSAEDLLAEHESIARCALEVYLRPLKRQHVRDFLSKAESTLGFRFGAQVAETLTVESSGFPYYIHLVGRACVECMLRRDPRSREVTKEDFVEAQKRASEQAFRSVLAKWRVNLRHFDVKERELLKAILMHKESQPPYADIRHRLVSSRSFTVEDFDLTLKRLERDRRIVYHDMHHKRDALRFHDPLLRLFLRARLYPRFHVPAEQEDSTPQLALFDDTDDDDT